LARGESPEEEGEACRAHQNKNGRSDCQFFGGYEWRENFFCGTELGLDPLALLRSIDILATWLAEVDTDSALRDCIVEYAKGRGSLRMSDICHGMDARYCRMAQDQDEIGWRRFMEGMVCRGLREIQETYSVIKGSNVSLEQWTTGLVTRLLEATQGQWLYCCVKINDRVKGTQATQCKEELQQEIEAQQEQGYEGLLEEDQYLMEVNLDNLEGSSGERQEYWLVMMRAMREAGLL
jgi:hypothetical protein